MHVEVGLVKEGLTAHVTGELVGVDLVSGQLIVGSKGVVAMDAAHHRIRVLAGTNTVMSLEGGQEGVSIVAITAAVGHGPALNTPPGLTLVLGDLQ